MIDRGGFDLKLRFIDPRMFKHIDWLLFANIMVLILFSLVAIASAVSEPLTEGTGSLSEAMSQLDLDYVVQQLTWFGVGLFALFVVLLPDYHAIGEYYKWIYIILIVLLVACTSSVKRSTAPRAGSVSVTRASSPARLARLRSSSCWRA